MTKMKTTMKMTMKMKRKKMNQRQWCPRRRPRSTRRATRSPSCLVHMRSRHALCKPRAVDCCPSILVKTPRKKAKKQTLRKSLRARSRRRRRRPRRRKSPRNHPRPPIRTTRASPRRARTRRQNQPLKTMMCHKPKRKLMKITPLCTGRRTSTSEQRLPSVIASASISRISSTALPSTLKRTRRPSRQTSLKAMRNPSSRFARKKRELRRLTRRATMCAHRPARTGLNRSCLTVCATCSSPAPGRTTTPPSNWQNTTVPCKRKCMATLRIWRLALPTQAAVLLPLAQQAPPTCQPIQMAMMHPLQLRRRN
eukprot:m.894928 g.894928  ORF g.894928 m.894928 type:complete len:310 (+) comp59990_c0_seq1:193-1122(+)